MRSLQIFFRTRCVCGLNLIKRHQSRGNALERGIYPRNQGYVTDGMTRLQSIRLSSRTDWPDRMSRRKFYTLQITCKNIKLRSVTEVDTLGICVYTKSFFAKSRPRWNWITSSSATFAARHTTYLRANRIVTLMFCDGNTRIPVATQQHLKGIYLCITCVSLGSNGHFFLLDNRSQNFH